MTEQRKRIERGLRECAEHGVPPTVDLWPAIRERVSGQRASGERMVGERTGDERAVGNTRRRWLPRLVPNTLLGWTLAVLSVLILGAGAYAASGPVADLLRYGLPGPAAPGVEEQPDGSAEESGSVAEERAVREVVERFGERLIAVTLSIPDERVVARHIRKEYGPFVTPELLESWAMNPQNAPGRAVSSPWPDKIEILKAREVEEGLFRVEGEVIYMSSGEIAKGGAAYRERVVLSVRKGRDGTWRISEYRVMHPPRQ
jgi:hypothetical protein